MLRSTLPLLFIALALAACDRGAPSAAGVRDEAASRADAAVTASGPAASAAAQRKLNAYVDAYNSLNGGTGLGVIHEDYQRLDIPHAQPGKNLIFVRGSLAYAAKAIKAARALPGADVHGLDALADRLVPRLEALDRELGDLALYYDAKGYQEDKLTKGRARHPVVESLFDTAHAAAMAFGNAVEVALAERASARLLALKASGDTAAYNSALAMNQAKELLDSFIPVPSLKAAGVYAKTDPIARALDETLVSQRRALDLAKAGKTVQPGSLLDRQEELAGNLANVLGSYRALRTSRDDYDYNQMLDTYNRAVETSNRMVMR